jgi:uncharacterized protein YjeT (DUF2065 family)
MKRMMAQIQSRPDRVLRIAGSAAALLAVLLTTVFVSFQHAMT